MPEQKISVGECNKKNGRLWWAVGLITSSLIGMGVPGITWSVHAGYSSQRATQQVESRLSSHTAAQEEAQKSVQDSLKRIEEQVEITDERFVQLLQSLSRRESPISDYEPSGGL
jgi:septal ring factor EnvC (AmiA/AmiB activator)